MSLEKIKNKDNIEIVTNAKIKELKEDNDKLSSVILVSGREIKTSCVFINIGNVPMPIKCDGLNMDEGYIIVDLFMKTNLDKIYACGDIIRKNVYQISTAVGEGTVAAMSIMKDIN